MMYIVYETRNLIDGKVYVGCHATENVDDGYLGSGKWLKRAIRKYGKESFQRKILHLAQSREEMLSMEKQIVTPDFLQRDDVYNLKRGGEGGNPGKVGAFTGKHHSEETKKRLSEKARGRKLSKEACENMQRGHWSKRDPEAQRKHARRAASKPKSEEHKERIRQALLARNRNKNLGP